jgi:hypothetical protein
MNTQTQEAFEKYCKTLNPLWNTVMSRTYAEEFFFAGYKAALEQPAQEPVAVKNANGITLKQGWDDLPDDTLLYSHPHQWQGLTDDEIDDIIDNVFSKSTIEKNGVKTCSVREGVRAIEQALKDKNDH